MKIYLKEKSASAYLTIIPAMTLHPIFTSGFERTTQGFATLKNGTLQTENIDKEKTLWRDLLMPLLQKETVDSGKIFIIVLPEMIKPEVFEFDARRNRLITEFGKFLRKLVRQSAGCREWADFFDGRELENLYFDGWQFYVARSDTFGEKRPNLQNSASIKSQREFDVECGLQQIFIQGAWYLL